jgi:hypothetical protein
LVARVGIVLAVVADRITFSPNISQLVVGGTRPVAVR